MKGPSFKTSPDRTRRTSDKACAGGLDRLCRLQLGRAEAHGNVTGRGMILTKASSADTTAPTSRTKAVPSDLRFILRNATDAAHRRLDAGFASYDLTRRADYAAFLLTMHQAFAPIEGRLDAADPGFLPPDWHERRRGDALRADLSGLGMADVARAKGSLPLTGQGAEAVGMLYVLEGSRLGAQILLRQVVASPEQPVRENARFLSHGEGRRLWASFAVWLGARPGSEHADAIRGALCAFALFEAAQNAG